MERINEILTELKAAADHPSAALESITKTGRKAIGCMPMYCPQELIYAAGMTPIAIWGADIELKEAKKFFPAFICSVMQTSLELGLRGELDALSGIIIPSLCDSMKCMGQNWKAGVPQVPYIPLFHPQNRKSDAGVTFLASEYRRVLSQLESIAGRSVSDGEIEGAIEVYNKHRLTMQRFSETAAKYPQIITPTLRSAVIKSAGFMDVLYHTVLIAELCAELIKKPQEPWLGKKIVITGILADIPSILRLFEENNLVVVADEIAEESRRFRTLVPSGGEALERLARQMALHEGCSVMLDPEKKRGGMILDMVERFGAHGVVVLMTKFCDPEEFDYAIMRKQFIAANVPHLVIEVDRQTQSYGQAGTALQAFADII